MPTQLDLFDVLPAGLVHLDASLKIQRANAAGAKALGFDRASADFAPSRQTNPHLSTAARGMELAECANDAWQSLNVPLRRALTTGESFTFWGFQASTSSHDDFFDVTLSPITGNGTIEGVLISAVPATERVKAEHSVQQLIQELQRSLEKLRSTFDQMTDGVLVTAPDGRISTANNVASTMLGKAAESLNASPRLYHLDRHPLTNEELPWRRASELGEAVVGAEILAPSEQTDDRIIAVNAAPLRSPEGALEGAVSVLRDVTEQRNLIEKLRNTNERLEEFNRLKAEFVANMSHELRTPLTAVIGFAQLALMKESRGLATLDVYRDLTNRVLRNSTHLLALVDEVLDLSRIESGRIELHSQYVDPQKLVQEVYESLQSLALQRNLEFRYTVTSDMPLAWIDPTRVKQIVVNLISNALKFTDRGGVYITASASVDTSLRVSVRDTGAGIADDDIKLIFERFRQLDGALTRKAGGAGLGLSIANELAHVMGGTIEVESKIGYGSTFTVVLPRQVPTEVLTAPASLRPAAPQGAPTVLVVEDNDDSASIVTTTLSESGYRVIRAANVTRAIEIAGTERPAAITLDVMLPDRDGWSALRDLKGSAATRDIPVLITSILDNRPLAFQLGAADYLRKPISPQQMLDALERVGASSQAHTSEDNRTVLIVDDDHGVRELLGATVRELGFAPRIATNGAEALRILKNERPRAILLDLMMPGMSGYEVFTRLKSSAETANIPVVIVSGQEIHNEDRALFRGQLQRVLKKGDLLMSNLPDTLRDTLADVGVRGEA